MDIFYYFLFAIADINIYEWIGLVLSIASLNIKTCDLTFLSKKQNW